MSFKVRQIARIQIWRRKQAWQYPSDTARVVAVVVCLPSSQSWECTLNLDLGRQQLQEIGKERALQWFLTHWLWNLLEILSTQKPCLTRLQIVHCPQVVLLRELGAGVFHPQKWTVSIKYVLCHGRPLYFQNESILGRIQCQAEHGGQLHYHSTRKAEAANNMVHA